MFRYALEHRDELLSVGARLAFGALWLQGASWKEPPLFGLATHGNLYYWMSRAVEYPVWGPYAWVMGHVILPHFLFFAWAVYLTEIALGVTIVLGLRLRWFLVVATFMTINIMLTVFNTPGEWYWSYLLMLMVEALLFAHPYADSPFSLDYWLARGRAARAALHNS